ncbi:hypothetical protein L596_016904 [Steinernema carpocapsae]|uniref:Nucleotide-diphospho-sugar transferase domain-containing protein n=1 Tax=Steinernema carpocapsae TaxID=34508 RepID=A0A4U5NL05_STECR|nr:hypothetical protein L596_016904 [Steinernema carpocapsae]
MLGPTSSVTDLLRTRFLTRFLGLSISIFLFAVVFWLYNVSLHPKTHNASSDYPIVIQRTRDMFSNETRDIGILTIVDETANLDDYHFALDSMGCYAALQNYSFRIERVSQKWSALCNQTDIMMKRHCMVAHLLDDHEYSLVIDADIGVINPEKLIEDYIDERFDIIMYERFFNWEIAMGSFLIKRSNFSKEFFLNFANYELPNSKNGRDNGAVHIYLAELLVPLAKTEIQDCRSIWASATSYSDVFLFEACIKLILGSIREFPTKIKIHEKGTAWVRDGWITDSRWNPEVDFMIHGWQLRSLKSKKSFFFSGCGFACWRNPFFRPINQSECATGTTMWHYNADLLATKDEIRTELETLKIKVKRDFWTSAGKLAKYFR